MDIYFLSSVLLVLWNAALTIRFNGLVQAARHSGSSHTDSGGDDIVQVVYEDLSESGSGNSSSQVTPRNLAAFVDLTAGGFSVEKWWEYDPRLDKHVVNYCLLGRLDKDLMLLLSRSIKYLEAGSNLSFQNVGACLNRRSVIEIDADIRDCYLRPNRRTGRYRLLIRECNFFGSMVGVLLRSIGFVPEADRDDLPRWIARGNNYRKPPVNSRVSKTTQYDIASILHGSFRHTSEGSELYGYDTDAVTLTACRRSFLSTCDWNLLNTVYPGLRKPPTCLPGKVIDTVRPDGEWDEVDADTAKYRCKYCNYQLYDYGKCVPIVSDSEFPSLGFIPGTETFERDRRRARLMSKYGKLYESQASEALCNAGRPSFSKWLELFCRVSGGLSGVEQNKVSQVCGTCSRGPLEELIACLRDTVNRATL